MFTDYFYSAVWIIAAEQAHYMGEGPESIVLFGRQFAVLSNSSIVVVELIVESAQLLSGKLIL
jgi:hypothetical protein